MGWGAQCWLGQCDYVHAAQDKPSGLGQPGVDNDKHYCFTKAAEVLRRLKSVPPSHHLMTVSRRFSCRLETKAAMQHPNVPAWYHLRRVKERNHTF